MIRYLWLGEEKCFEWAGIEVCKPCGKPFPLFRRGSAPCTPEVIYRAEEKG